MNPLEYFDLLEQAELKKIKENPQEQYTKEEVLKIIADMSLKHRKAIYNGEHVFTIEDVNQKRVTINEDNFVIQKLLTHDNKYLLFVQITDVYIDDFGDEDMNQLSESISKAVEHSENIAGVILLPPFMELSLVTAKLDTLSYAEKLEFNDDDKEFISNYNYKFKTHYNSSTTTESIFRDFCSAYEAYRNNKYL